MRRKHVFQRISLTKYLNSLIGKMLIDHDISFDKFMFLFRFLMYDTWS